MALFISKYLVSLRLAYEQTYIRSALGRAFRFPRELMRPLATRASKRSAKGQAIIIISARPPTNLALTRLKPSRGRRNACPAALISDSLLGGYTQTDLSVIQVEKRICLVWWVARVLTL